MDTSRRKSWRLVVSSANIDSATPQGELYLNMLSSFAQFESRIIGQRVERQHQARRERGITWGLDQGYRGTLDPNTRRLIAELDKAGNSLREIISELEAQNITTARGGKWYPATIKAYLDSPQTKALAV
jgi:DNA invertase Pin-like site-specific DNA recombinase